MKPSFAVIALLVCFLGVLITTISSHGPFELATDNQEDESKLRVSEEAVEGDGIDQEDEEEESEDVDDENEVDNSESVNVIPEADPVAWGRYGRRGRYGRNRRYGR
ncbi:unnamed protein product [Porites lobata]|uniref:Uncharacterized protein n=1 Tax=Porites lobata TaxID=104759 RepID=A0ABN8NXT4_9CNID|nr:unnamed protein product [Porites lobata]